MNYKVVKRERLPIPGNVTEWYCDTWDVIGPGVYCACNSEAEANKVCAALNNSPLGEDEKAVGTPFTVAPADPELVATMQRAQDALLRVKVTASTNQTLTMTKPAAPNEAVKVKGNEMDARRVELVADDKSLPLKTDERTSLRLAASALRRTVDEGMVERAVNDGLVWLMHNRNMGDSRFTAQFMDDLRLAMRAALKAALGEPK